MKFRIQATYRYVVIAQTLCNTFSPKDVDLIKSERFSVPTCIKIFHDINTVTIYLSKNSYIANPQKLKPEILSH